MEAITLNWPSIIEFGGGKIQTLRDHLKGSKRIFVLCDQTIKDQLLPLLDEIKNQEKADLFISTDVVPEPPIEALLKILQPVKEFSPDVIIGVGGGSALDLAKLVSVLFSGKQGVQEVIGIGNVLERKVKLIAVATTSGTGSEVTPIAILTDLKEKLKKGVVSKFLIPDISIVDPILTLTVPAAVTAATGMDAMTHCIEAYTNKHAHPIIDNLALEGICLIASSLEIAVKSPENVEARTKMSLGSLYGGLCLGPVNTAAVHAMAYPLGGEFKVPHGVANSVLLPFVMNFNYISAIEKYVKIARALGVTDGGSDGSSETLAKAGVLKIREISKNCQIPSGIKDLGIPESAISFMAEAAMKVTRLMNNNPRAVALNDAKAIYQMAYRGVIE